MKGRRTLWTRLADAAMTIGSYGPTRWKVFWQARTVSWALRYVRWQWFNGHHWIDRTSSMARMVGKRR